MRKKIVVGNWKMNLSREEGLLLVSEITSKIESQEKQVIFAPPFIITAGEIDELFDAFDRTLMSVMGELSQGKASVS